MAFKVPGYEVGPMLGRGSHATVWSGTHTPTGERVALKWVEAPPGHGRAGLRAEATLLQQLRHPSLIGFLDFVELPGAAVLVLELAEGGCLSTVLARRQRLSPDEVALSFSDIGAALAHAHEAGVVHGDISSANILYTAAGRPKLADLGVARIAGGRSEFIGTPAYLDPVVAAGGPVGVASDLFSLGAVALHALCGQAPWAGSSVEEVLAVAARGELEGLSDRLAGCPPLMRQALAKVLHRQPLRRGTAAEFALALRACGEPTPVVLEAGRLNPGAGRHAASRVGPSGADPDSGALIGPRAPIQLDRPAFQRPGPVRPAGVIPAAQLTHVSRPQLRAELAAVPPAPGRRRRLQSVLAILALCASVCGGALATGLWRPSVASALPWHRSAAALVATPAPTASSIGAPASRSPIGGTVGGVSMDSATATAILRRLDAVRVRAYAENDPTLLEKVYAGAEVLTIDRAQLVANVPPGCVLTGLDSSYSRVSVYFEQPGSVEVSAVITVAAGRRSCHGVSDGTSSPTAPTAYAITLSGNRTAGYRIASQTLLLGGR